MTASAGFSCFLLWNLGHVVHHVSHSLLVRFPASIDVQKPAHLHNPSCKRSLLIWMHCVTFYYCRLNIKGELFQSWFLLWDCRLWTHLTKDKRAKFLLWGDATVRCNRFCNGLHLVVLIDTDKIDKHDLDCHNTMFHSKMASQEANGATKFTRKRFTSDCLSSTHRGKSQLESMAGNYHDILVAMGENPDREGLRDTPMRAAKAMMFFTKVRLV